MKPKYLFVFLLLWLSLCAYLFQVIYTDARNQAVDELNARQTIHARQARRGIEDFFRETTAFLTEMAESRHVVRLDDQGRRELDFASGINPEAITAFTRVDPGGRIVYSTPVKEGVVGVDISSQRHMRRILETRRTVVSDVFTAVEGYPAIALHVPVFDGDDFNGTLGVLVDFKFISRRYLEVIRLGDTGYAWMTSADGIELYCPVPGHIGHSVFDNCRDFPTILEMAREMLAGRQGVTTYQFDRIRERKLETITKHAVYMPIQVGDTFWSIVVASSEAEVLATLSRFREKLVLVVVLLLAGSVVFAYYGMKAWGIVREASRRREAEVALRQERDLMQRIMETSPAGIVRVDAGGRVVYANRRAESILGLKMDDIAKRTYDDPDWRITDCDGNPFPEDRLPFAVVRRTGAPVSDARHVIQWPDGRRTLLSINASPLVSAVGAFDGIVATIDDITERHEAEQRYRMLFREMIDGFAIHEIICDERGEPADYRFLAANPAFERLTGLKAEAIVDRTVLEVLPDTEPLWIERYGRVARTGEPASFESFSRELGRHFQVTAFRHAPGQFACIFVDITERKRAEEALRESERKFSIAFHHSPVVMSITTLEEGVFLDVNEPFLRLTGLAREAVIGRRAADLGLWQGEGREALLAELGQQGFVHGRPVELAIPSTDRRVPLLWFGDVVRIEDRPCILASGFDLSRQKAAEAALEETTRRFRMVFNSQLDAIFVLDAAVPARIVEANAAVHTVFGYPPEEMVGRTIARLHVDDEHLSTFQKELFAAIRRDGFLEGYEFTMRRADGNVFPSEHSVLELKNDAGERTGWVSIVRDLTEKRQVEQRLRQMQKMESIGNLAGGIAHDFNNLLFPIVGMAEMLLEDTPAGSPAHECAREILAAGKRASHLVKQILTFSRQTEHRMIPVHLQQVVKEVLNLSRATIPSNIEVARHLQPDCGLVQADPIQVHQVAMNLITNAYHAVAEAGGRIEVTLAEVTLEADARPASPLPPGRYVRLTVSDTGTGIAPEIMDKIFEPYFTTKEKGKGTGLGLATVYGIVQEHGGDVRVRSTPGEGTTFDVYLPRMETADRAPAAERVPIEPTGDERILLVDDEASVARIERQILGRLGYRVTAFQDSPAALEAFRADPQAFDLVITDMAMPQMTGDQLAARLIAVRPDIPVIICTGFSERIDADRARRIGIRGFLMKPVVKSEMARMVREVLDGAGSLSGP